MKGETILLRCKSWVCENAKINFFTLKIYRLNATKLNEVIDITRIGHSFYGNRCFLICISNIN